MAPGWQRWARFALVLAWNGHFLLRAHDIASFAGQDQFERDAPPVLLPAAAILILPAGLAFLTPVRGCAMLAVAWSLLGILLGRVAAFPGAGVPMTFRGLDTLLLGLASLGLVAIGVLGSRDGRREEAANGP